MEDNNRFLEHTEEKLSSLDGYFNIAAEEDGFFLTVYPQQGTGEPVKVPKIIEALAELGIDKVDNALLTRVVREALGTPVKVAEKPVEAEPEI